MKIKSWNTQGSLGKYPQVCHEHADAVLFHSKKKFFSPGLQLSVLTEAATGGVL